MMLHPDVIMAHIRTLREWSAMWSVDAEPGTGAAEVAFLMLRTAKVAEAAMKEEPIPAPTERPRAADQHYETRPD